jgi:hygromycin-B 4-O-kinase
MNTEVAAVAAFLAGRYSEVGGVEEIGRGEWSVAYGFRGDGEELVIRIGAHVEDFEADRRAEAYAGPDLPVPRILEIGECPRLGGGVYAIAERAHGTAIDLLDADGLRRAVPSLLRGLDAMRALPAPPPEQPWAEFLVATTTDDGNPRTGGWRPALDARPALAARFDEASAAMPELLDRVPADPRWVVHADLFNRNVLADPETGRITAFLDWGCTFTGDFLFDIAWLVFWSPWHPNLEAVGIRERTLEHYAAIGLDVPGFDERIRCYGLWAGLNSMGFMALTDRWDELERLSLQTLDLLA